MYLLSVLVSIIVAKISDMVTKIKLEEKGYIYKRLIKPVSFDAFINLILKLIPYLNLISASLEIILTTILLTNEKILLEFIKKSENMYSAKNVKDIYECCPVKEDVLKDAMILDGADEIAIDKEMNKVETYLKGIQLDNSIWSVLDRVEFTEEEYKWACAQYNAEQLIEDIQLIVH